MPYQINEIKELLYPVFRQHNVRKAVLLGSASKGHNTAESDIDIMVDSGLKGLSFFGLLEDVCSAINCPIDLIDTQDIESGSELQTEILHTGVPVATHYQLNERRYRDNP